MKKLVTTFAFILVISIMMSAKSVEIKKQDPSSCVSESRSRVEALAKKYGWDIHNGGSECELAVEVYMILYKDCLNR